MTVTRPARLTGAALAGALALVPFVWILRDLAALGSPEDLFWYWAGDRFRLSRARAATTLLDPVLCVAAAGTALAALRSRHAAAALAATGAVTLAVRLPGLWTHGTGPLVTALAELALGTGLLVTALAGRRPRRARTSRCPPGRAPDRPSPPASCSPAPPSPWSPGRSAGPSGSTPASPSTASPAAGPSSAPRSACRPAGSRSSSSPST
ncbi:hypothetical protein ACWV2X_34665 [Streptomyces hydrogenans]